MESNPVGSDSEWQETFNRAYIEWFQGQDPEYQRVFGQVLSHLLNETRTVEPSRRGHR